MRIDSLSDFVSDIFFKLGVPPDSAHTVAEAVVAADMEGIPSHGVMLVPMYVERMLAGSVSTRSELTS